MFWDNNCLTISGQIGFITFLKHYSIYYTLNKTQYNYLTENRLLLKVMERASSFYEHSSYLKSVLNLQAIIDSMEMPSIPGFVLIPPLVIYKNRTCD